MVDDVLSQIKDFVAARPLIFTIFMLVGALWFAYVAARFKYPESRSELNKSIKKWAPKVMLSSLPFMFLIGMTLMLLSSNSGHNFLTLLFSLVCGSIFAGVSFAFGALSGSSTYYKRKRNLSSS